MQLIMALDRFKLASTIPAKFRSSEHVIYSSPVWIMPDLCRLHTQRYIAGFRIWKDVEVTRWTTCLLTEWCKYNDTIVAQMRNLVLISVLHRFEQGGWQCIPCNGSTSRPTFNTIAWVNRIALHLQCIVYRIKICTSNMIVYWGCNFLCYS